MICVTTFSQKGYELYGKRFLETFVENWPCKIVVYYETLPDFQHEKVIYKPLLEVFGVQAFLQYCDRMPIFRGMTEFGYNYNYDAKKFCRKVFAQLDTLKEHQGKVVWLDADSFFKKPITEEFIDDIYGDAGVVYLGREGFHSESGFLGFDTERDGFGDFVEQYTRCYRKGVIFTLKRWHDCEALDWALNQKLVKSKNLTAGWKDGDSLDVLEDTVLGEYMEHLKGKRKFDSNLH